MTTIKLLIFSDSHGRMGGMLEIAEKERPDEILHLGDCWEDAKTLAFAFPQIPTVMVPGNCDRCAGQQETLLLEREGWKLLLGHGHQWRVKSGGAPALAAAREAGADLLLYGHTHVALCLQDSGIWVLNPGTVGGVWAPASYGVVTLEPGRLEPRVVFL